jgi:hypothetical protein
MLPAICIVVVVCFFALVFYAVHRKGHVRATLKGPLAFLVEFEADDERREGDKDPKRG